MVPSPSLSPHDRYGLHSPYLSFFHSPVSTPSVACPGPTGCAAGRLLCNDTHNRLFFVMNTRDHSLSQHLRRTTVGATQRVCVADSPVEEQEIYVRPISQPAPDQEALRASLCARRSDPGAVGLLSDEEVIAIMQWWALYEDRRRAALQRFAPDTLNLVAMPDVPVPPLVHETDYIRYSSYGPGR